MKKYGLKFKWTDATTLTESAADYTADATSTGNVISYDATKEEAKGLDHIVTSEAELVFATIEPLGFESGAAFAQKVDASVNDVNRLIEKAEVLENKIFDKIKAQIPNFDDTKIATINAKSNTDPTIAWGDLLTDGTDWWIEVNAGGSTLGAYDGQDVKMTEIISPLNTSLGNVKDMFTQLNSLKEKLNASTVTNWAEKFTNKFKTLFDNNAAQMLQPTLLAIDKEGTVNRVSGSKAAPYEATGEIRLEPTTYTAELFAPAYAKFLGCKDIKADGFNEILTNNQKVIKFTPEAGKTYEIVYEAVDFFGNIKSHTYYIKGKK